VWLQDHAFQVPLIIYTVAKTDTYCATRCTYVCSTRTYTRLNRGLDYCIYYMPNFFFHPFSTSNFQLPSNNLPTTTYSLSLGLQLPTTFQQHTLSHSDFVKTMAVLFVVCQPCCARTPPAKIHAKIVRLLGYA